MVFGIGLCIGDVFEQDNSWLVVELGVRCGLSLRCILNEKYVWVAKIGNVLRLRWGLVHGLSQAFR